VIRGLDEELRALKYSHVERERRFLVDPVRRPDLTGRPHILIEDKYIDGTRMRLRRMIASDTGRIVLKLGKKYEGADPLARPMVTTYLTDAEYALLGGLAAHPLVKRRYPLGAFSIDLFEGALVGLELAESGRPDAAALAALVPPDWALREVSEDPAYEGGTLALLDRPPAR
jgi:CYTH domain-containing protein